MTEGEPGLDPGRTAEINISLKNKGTLEIILLFSSISLITHGLTFANLGFPMIFFST